MGSWRGVVGILAGAGLAAACGAREPRVGEATLVCPREAAPVAGACACAAGLVVLDGACVGPREIEAYCGERRAAGAGKGGCPVHPCRADDALDLVTATCVPRQRARAVLSRIRPIADDLDVRCASSEVLVVYREYASCVPPASTCPRGTTWDDGAGDGGACAPLPACAPGEVREEPSAPDAAPDAGAGASPASGRCVRVVTRETRGEPVVDVGTWTRAILGPDGGEGTTRVCRALGLAAPLDVGPEETRDLHLTVDLVFPDNDVTAVSARVDAPGVPDGDAVADAARGALDPLLVPLRAMGGVADAASVTVRVRCRIQGGRSPDLAPRAPAPPAESPESRANPP
jgi:hypothetical protein